MEGKLGRGVQVQALRMALWGEDFFERLAAERAQGQDLHGRSEMGWFLHLGIDAGAGSCIFPPYRPSNPPGPLPAPPATGLFSPFAPSHMPANLVTSTYN
jgi:hypothetical protein